MLKSNIEKSVQRIAGLSNTFFSKAQIDGIFIKFKLMHITTVT